VQLRGFLASVCPSSFMQLIDFNVAAFPRSLSLSLSGPPSGLYMKCPVVSENVLHFWSSRSQMWPKLASDAGVILAIPATETLSKRVFSTAGRILEEHGTHLKGDSLDNLMFLHALKRQRVQQNICRHYFLLVRYSCNIWVTIF